MTNTVTLLNTYLKRFSAVGITLVICACSSNAIQPSYFTLTPLSAQVEKQNPEAQVQRLNEHLNKSIVGVGPIDMADTYERPGIVSFDQARVDISDRYFWSGQLSTAISRKLAQDLRVLVPDATFWPFPWDTRVRPETQLGISVLEIGGSLGGEVRLVVSWRLLTDRGRTLVKTGEFVTVKQSEDGIGDTQKYLAYVSAINECVDALAEILSVEFRSSLIDLSGKSG